MSKQQNIPALRFPEFEGEWEEKKLGEVIDELRSGVSVNSVDKPVNNGQKFGILKTSCISSGRFYPDQNKSVLDDEIDKVKLYAQKNTILISRMNTPTLVGESGYVEKDYPNLFIPDRIWMTVISEGFNVRFLSLLLSSPKAMLGISNIATGTSNSMKNISKPNFLGLEFYLPTLPEQQKIASFLTAIDTRIEQLTRKKALLEQYKKGVMQQIFSQQLRFKDDNGEDFPDWEEKKLGEGLKESRVIGQKGNLARKITVKLWGKGVYEKKEVTEGSENTQYYYRKAGQLIYSKLDFLNNAFGIIPNELDGFQSTLDLPTFDIDRSVFDAIFLIARITQKDFYKKNGDTADGSRKAKRIHPEDFLNFSIFIPTLKEQQKIATFISTLDQKVDQVNQQLDQTKTYKKGLLQQLFV